MSLIQQIRDDRLKARKERKDAESTLLTTLLGEAEMIGKNDGNRETTDSEVIAVIKKFIKNNGEIMAVVDANSPAALLAHDESMFINQYLPSQLTEHDITEYVQTYIGRGEPVNMGMMGGIMKSLNAAYPGQVDGKAASQIIRQIIQDVI